jgi:hypothetical protein
MGFRAISPDMLAQRLGVPIQEVQARLLPLELKNRVDRLSGGSYQVDSQVAKALAAQMAREAQAMRPEGDDGEQDPGLTGDDGVPATDSNPIARPIKADFHA